MFKKIMHFPKNKRSFRCRVFHKLYVAVGIFDIFPTEYCPKCKKIKTNKGWTSYV